MPSAADIVRHHDSDPLENPWVDGQPPPPERIEVHDYDPRWPELYRQLVRRIGDALGGLALRSRMSAPRRYRAWRPSR